MVILQVIGLGIVAVVIIAVLKAQKPEIAIQISIIAGILIFFAIAGKLSAVVELLKGYAGKLNIDTAYMGTLMKIIGIAYITEFGSAVCRDAGESSIASKIEMAGKVVIIALALPIMTSLIETIIKLMP